MEPSLPPGIVYFDLDQATLADLNQAMSEIEQARGIVFDLRGYPGDAGDQLMEHLIDAPATSQRWIVPVYRRPDRDDVQWSQLERWNLVPKAPRLTGQVAFLTDGRAISYAESIMGIVEHYKFGEIVGSTTAGTNGNVNPFTLPGGYRVSWTGMVVLKHDGSRHHGVGIAPTVPVVPTPAGIAAGKDEVLEKAVEVLPSQARL
jgi:C-terminal processing protease CtpA/Prc